MRQCQGQGEARAWIPEIASAGAHTGAQGSQHTHRTPHCTRVCGRTRCPWHDRRVGQGSCDQGRLGLGGEERCGGEPRTVRPVITTLIQASFSAPRVGAGRHPPTQGRGRQPPPPPAPRGRGGSLGTQKNPRKNGHF